MEVIEKSIEVNAPVNSVYNQWTQFEDFPEFMENVEEVRQISEKHLHWKTKIAGKVVEWDSEIDEQIPDELISWHSTSGAHNSGTVNFRALGPNKTRIDVQLEYEPHGAMENMGDALGVFGRGVEHNLKRFKDFIESTPETGGWRGRISGEQVQTPGEPRSKRIR